MCKDDEIRFRHMLDAAREAVLFVKGCKRGDLDNDRKLVLALVKDIEIVGEAANQITESIRLEYDLILGSKSLECEIAWSMPTST